MAYDRPSCPRQDMVDSTDIELKLPKMSDNGDRSSGQTTELQDGPKNYVSPSVQDEYKDEQRPARMPSPPMSEASNPPSTEQQTGIPILSNEFIAHLTQRITKEFFEQLKQAGNLDTAAEQSKAETSRNPELNADQTKFEPMARSPSNDKSCSTPSPPLSPQMVYTPPSPNSGSRRATFSSDSPPLSLSQSIPSSPTAEKPGVRFTNSRGSEAKNGRPAAYRLSSSTEFSTIDQKWGRLFDKDVNPTPRLGQFLRGLANHIIKEFQPRNSIVVTPDKMTAFYAKYVVDDEAYSLVSFFRQSHDRLSSLYQDLSCQHHLIQESFDKSPEIPGLTPVGFAQWMTTWILAYPDQEARRLEKVMVSMPIDADGEIVDGKPERLPKQISRRLLPSKEDPEAKRTLGVAISEFQEGLEDMSRKRRPSITSPQAPLPRRASSSAQSRPIDIPRMKTTSRGTERDRMSYSGPPTDAAIIQDTVKLERDRQPYTAKPGNGKVYTDSLSVPHATRPGRANSVGRDTRDSEPEGRRRHRTQSNASNSPYMPPPRPGGQRRAPSPPLQKLSHSNPGNLDIVGNYPPPPFNSLPKQSQSFSPTTYTPSKYLPPPDMRERDGDRYIEPRRYERRSNVDDMSRLPPEITTPRDTDRWDRMLGVGERERDRDRDRERERKYEPKSAGPILHQEFRPSVSPEEDFYRGAAPPRGGEWEVSKGGKYNSRH